MKTEVLKKLKILIRFLCSIACDVYILLLYECKYVLQVFGKETKTDFEKHDTPVGKKIKITRGVTEPSVTA